MGNTLNIMGPNPFNRDGVWVGGGLGYARRFARRGYFGLDLTAFASVTPNGVESGGSVSVVNRWSYDGDPPPARRYVAFRGGGSLNFIIGGWF